jgi:myo-inositol-1(or 4)-monophosphatase
MIKVNKLMRDLDKYLHFAIDMALVGGDIIREAFWDQENLKTEIKKDQTVATYIDKKVEKIYQVLVGKKFPEHRFLGEEESENKSSSDFRKEIKQISQDKENYYWIIDPLDGTNNFVAKIPFVCTAISLVYKNKVLLGVVYNPITEEIFYAHEKSDVAWTYLSNKKIKKALKKNFQDASFFYKSHKAFKNHQKLNKLEFKNCLAQDLVSLPLALNTKYQQLALPFINARAQRRLGSAALELCYVAMGNLGFYFEFGLKPWDVAASSLIAKKMQVPFVNLELEPYDLNHQELIACRKVYLKYLKS